MNIYSLLDISSNSNLLLNYLGSVFINFSGYDQNTTNYSLLDCHVNLYKKEQAL